MGIFSIFFNKNKPQKLITDKDFDKNYNIVFIDKMDDNVARIYEVNDTSYKSVLFTFNDEIKPKDIHVYPFSLGVKELCIKKLISIYFEKDVPKNRQDFIDYLKKAGCSDIVIDGFIACTASDINRQFMPKSNYVRVYDYSGKYLRTERKR